MLNGGVQSIAIRIFSSLIANEVINRFIRLGLLIITPKSLSPKIGKGIKYDCLPKALLILLTNSGVDTFSPSLRSDKIIIISLETPSDRYTLVITSRPSEGVHEYESKSI